MGVEIRNITDPAVEAEIFDTLTEAGFDPSMRDDVIVLSGVGHQGGDRSVDLEIDLLEMDSFRILQFRSLLRTQPSSFNTASLACTRGNSASTIPKFDVIELFPDATNPHRFGIRASLHLFADDRSREEIRVMLMLYLKEIDDIDNELAEIVLLH